MAAPDYIVVLITTANKEEAQEIAQSLLEQHQAACVNIITGVDSRFWWQEQIDSAQECLLIVKSKAALLSSIIDLVKKSHSYTVPEIIALPIIGGNEDYLKWVGDEVRES